VNIAGTLGLIVLFRRRIGGFEMGETVRSFVLVTVASAVLAAVAWWGWHLLDVALGRSLPAQIVSLGLGLAIGFAAFFGACRLLGVRELETLWRLRRLRA
jgi:putative peptidoglycan lipid II flippase